MGQRGRPGPSIEKLEAIRQAVSDGWPLRQIIETYQVSSTTVKKHFQGYTGMSQSEAAGISAESRKLNRKTTEMPSREVWRRILEAPAYEINSRGHVRLAGSGKKLIPEKGLVDNAYKLWNKGDPKKYRMSDLVRKYFPEMVEGGRPSEWRKLEEFPDYEVSSIGIIRNVNTKYELPLIRTGGLDAKVALYKDGARGVHSLTDLVASVFNNSRVS